MDVVRDGKRETRESYLPEVYELAAATGRRISAICQLRAEDIDLTKTDGAPWGGINWPGEFDKQGRRWRAPISADARKALQTAMLKRQAAGSGWLFPGPRNASKPLRSDTVAKWLRKAEEKAKVEHLDGGLWHPYRRLWATSRKGMPDVDVAQAGGWSSLDALKTAYQQPDDATMLAVVTGGVEIRERKRG